MTSWIQRYVCLAVLLLSPAVLAQPSVQTELDRGLRLLNQGDSASAITVLEQVAQTAPRSAAVQRVLGLAYQRQEQYPEAITALRKAVELEPTNVQGHVSLGWTLHLAGQEAEAAHALWQGIERDPKSVEAYNALGIVRLAQDNVEAAMAVNRWALQLKPDNEVAHYNLALACQRAWDWSCALEGARQAAQLEPSNPHPLFAAAITYQAQHQEQNVGPNRPKDIDPEAKRYARRATELDSRFFDAAYLKSNLRRAGFSTEQIQTAQQILRVAP
ncbi:tetratricopeptide repeat protein [Leptolyngbya sp. FACHB-261]|uniref:tetratricopeptide repeat protein n=1 Tax=Leptolyngbya sp. FACHB-261 TaxID=2692806 RepID=UPI0016863B3B|nr:tetratricopeptide repeat protein [Leptolyngbya sp. FACHB-261]MBD2104738.1 tetratricopeptide repeat protein [Leptolyngbya sp. FACHB-261]